MALNEKEVQEFKNEFIRLNGEREANLSSVMVLIKTIESLQHENEKLKDENASLRNWNACEEKAHYKLLESDKRRWELEEKLEDANNYLEGLEAIVDKLRAQVGRIREALDAEIEAIGGKKDA